MALWVLIVWLVVGAITGFVVRMLAKRKSPFGKIGDVILGLAGGIVGGYLVAISGVDSTLGWLLVSIAAAVAGAVILVWSTKLLTRP